ncbi:hypothetical protein IW140_004322 [Coemansia sp. RSA 1813]|nr:hypothetical protein EV178_004394 [Coemansia sp. RSA 1646]KAJ1769402.1 hypothetical protein LPJ74_004065 [Coemansia sp. RSA 1843]KAJ2087974.1 hypothetical protein IW138_004571 [Coemansia sp. RSA 986]KAJ2211258.1 hypothetical protein EV179_005622 [Coemansia sp. RSA 487]KAJ2567812.1 hypothetical protein IW140_004322 [Coemansia sp. RSA 1813]
MVDGTATRSRWETDDTSSSDGHRTKKQRKKRSAPLVKQEAEQQQNHHPDEKEGNSSVSIDSMEEILPTHMNNGHTLEHLGSCRPIDQCYERLNKIEEGTYGIVYRAKDLHTGEIVALKHLKLENERNGFPITSLREIHTLLLAKHPNIINVHEVVVGRSLNSVYMVMDYMEHDLRTLMESMPEGFRPSEIKTLMLQLLSAVKHLHANWLVHRDLKTSNLLMANGGALRVADFGLARKYSSPLHNMTGLVVTLWYRAPELLLGETAYSTAVDVWSVGCIFAELFLHKPLFQGQGEIDQITKIFAAIGAPTENSWPAFHTLPNAKMFRFTSVSNKSKGLRSRVQGYSGMTEEAFDLLSCLLTLDPGQRITAEDALKHPYFEEAPPPKHPSMFPTWPSK